MTAPATPAAGAAHTAESIAEAIRPTLEQFVAGAAPYIRKVTESIYDDFLGMVQDYIVENGQWNIGEQVRRSLRVDAENVRLREVNAAMLAALQLQAKAREAGMLNAPDLWAVAGDAMDAAIARATGAA